jgi:hypothetical protein
MSDFRDQLAVAGTNLEQWDVLIRLGRFARTSLTGIGVAGIVVRTLAPNPQTAVRYAQAPWLLKALDADARATARKTDVTVVPADRPLIDPEAAPSPAGPDWPAPGREVDWPVFAAAQGTSEAALLAIARRVCRDAGVPTPAGMREVREIRAPHLVTRLLEELYLRDVGAAREAS